MAIFSNRFDRNLLIEIKVDVRIYYFEIHWGIHKGESNPVRSDSVVLLLECIQAILDHGLSKTLSRSVIVINYISLLNEHTYI